jgi:hypothetical protein
MLSGSEHRASAALRSTTTCIKALDRCASTALDRQLIVNKKLFPFVNGPKRNKKDPLPVLLGLAVRRATMIEPPSRITVLPTVDNAAIVQIEEEGMAVFPARLLMLALRFFPRNELSAVFDNEIARIEVGHCKDTSTMNRRISDSNATHSKRSVEADEGVGDIVCRGALQHNATDMIRSVPHASQTLTHTTQARSRHAHDVRERIVEVLGEARGERVMIRSVHADGVERRSAVKWVNLVPLGRQLF